MKHSLKTYVGAGAMILSLVAMMPFSALASNGQGKNRDHSVSIRPQIDVRETVQVNPNGEVTLRGAVKSVGTASLMVKSWGGDWTINIGTGVKLISRANAVLVLADMKVGDIVTVHGSMKPNAGLTVDARQIKDQFIPDRAVVVRGTIASIDANTLTVKSGDTTWTAATAATTKFVAKFGGVTTLTAMKVGDEVMVKGVLAAGSATAIQATEIKDISLVLTVEKPKKFKMDDEKFDDRGGRKNQ